MKRILSLVLILLVLAGTFTACFDQPDQTTENVVYDVQLGLQALKGTYQSWNSNNAITVDTKLDGQVQYRGVFYKVTWATESEAVTLTANEDGTTTLAVTRGASDVNFSLVATVSTPDGKSSVSHTFELVVPAAISSMSHSDYIGAADGDEVEIMGIITVANSKTAGAKYNEMYLEDLEGKGGYYIYSFTGGTDVVNELGLKPGMTVKVVGTKAIYNKTHEVKNATVTVVDSSIKNVTTFDLTEKFISASDATDAVITDYLGTIVTIKGVQIGGTYDEQYYHYFELDGLQSYIRLADSCGLPADVLATLKAEHKIGRASCRERV